ncbi:glucose-1-phosphate adenylyltransferase, partial [Vibrio cholerae HC-50A2]
TLSYLRARRCCRTRKLSVFDRVAFPESGVYTQTTWSCR